ncbi:UvrD-helicase domain-containing protein [Paracoccus sphaerophysae]|uniref:UvrD-helicase domain-containing protein n=1 Tax=Paracoccus sphaerophysae TaxID=690417 RepID=UPI0023571EA6|nr:UvrD-helicase domain-containing protein [Paracoccus sphaerophysae]
MDDGLVIVPAGAGAGKTHRIQEQLSNWVRRDVVRPDRILAVTFTEAAASELRARIRGALLADGMVEAALAVEGAYVSTIHGLGLRLLTEHALAAGASPRPRHLGDAERDLLIRQALAHAKALDPIKADPGRYGYSSDFVTGTSAEDQLRGAVLAMIDLLRGLGDAGRDPGLIAPALARLDSIYGPVLARPDKAKARLIKAIRAMLAAFPEGCGASVTAKTAADAFDRQHRDFQRIARDPDLLDRDWALWQRLRTLRVSNRQTKTPPGHDDLAQAIMDAADVLPTHPGPLADARQNLSCLIACAQEVMEAYEAKKRSLGLIDFADMIAGAERLLRCDPAVRQAVLGEIDCVIIDEFQDTNPVQFALLWQLAKAAPRTLLVGDVKQSIMGFQGADARLSAALAAAHPQSVQPLTRNWRSTPAVMQAVNAIGKGLFGAAYTSLDPTRDPCDGPGVEILRVPKGPQAKNGSRPHEHIAERIAQMLVSEETVTDRVTKATRPIRPDDVAVLVYTHAAAARYAAELRARGIPVRISEDGWSGAPVVQVACAALAYAANPDDLHSALMLRTLGPNPLSLEEALRRAIADRMQGDPVLAALAALADELPRLPVSLALGRVLDACGLRAWALGQNDPAQARADLLRLEAEALNFETAHRDLRAAAGFHGETAKVFLGWLAARTAERDFDRRPDPSADSAEAVEIVTWHAAKGREWPVTVVAEMQQTIAERPGTTSTRFERLNDFDDLAAMMRSARLIHTPKLAAPEAQARFVEDRRPDFEANARNLLYVALTRARDRLVIEWPDFLKERDEDAAEATCLFHVLSDCCGARVNVGKVTFSGVKCPAKVIAAPEFAALTHWGAAPQRPLAMGPEARMPPQKLTPWRLQPSQLRPGGAAPPSETVVLGAPWAPGVSSAVRGTALHLALRVMLTRPDRADALTAATGLDAETIGLVAQRADALRRWLTVAGFPELTCEMPVAGLSPKGAEIPGTVDLLATGPAGAMLVDHKTGGSGEGLGPHWPQLNAYARLFRGTCPQYPVRRVAVFWVDHGRLEFAAVE